MSSIKSDIKMVMFDLSGTTVYDDTGVRDCLYKAAQIYKLDVTPEEILNHMGTNKIHLYQFLLARSRGNMIDFRDFERNIDMSTYEEAKEIYDCYVKIMIDHYHKNCREVEGTSDTFRWCHDNGIKVATDTGFHNDVTTAIMDALGWVRDGLVDLSVDLDMVPEGKGRPAPFMIFHAMQHFNIQNVREVIKIGDTPADMLEGYNAGCRAVIGVMSGPRPVTVWGQYYHTHVIDSVKDLPALIENGMIV